MCTAPYHFTRPQLYRLLQDTIDLYTEQVERYAHDAEHARAAAISELLEGLDAEQDLYADHEISELRLQSE